MMHQNKRTDPLRFAFLILSLSLALTGCSSDGVFPILSSSAIPAPSSPVSASSISATSSAVPSNGIGTLAYIGRASVKITLTDGTILYIDPYAGKKAAYQDAADLVLVTHQDYDHNKISLVTMQDGGDIIQCPLDITAGSEITTHGISVMAVDAYNRNHPKGEGCGYVLRLGEVVLYHSGDTSTTEQMPEFKDLSIDYALLCTDGTYNMGMEEAMKVAALIGAKHFIPIHTSGDKDFDQANADSFASDMKIVLKPGEVITLAAD